MRRGLALWLAVLAVGLSCAGKAPSRTQTAEAPGAYVEPEAPPTPRDEIQDLWMQIRGWRAELELGGVEPNYALIRATSGMSMSELRKQLARMCEQPVEPSKTCDDTCSIAEHICENAERICDIADDLGNGPWEKQKCDSAKASCKQAKRRCCECESENGDDDGDGDGETEAAGDVCGEQ